MLNELNPKDKDFAAIYIVCGFIDMRCSINTLSAMIETKFHTSCSYHKCQVWTGASS